MRTLLKKKHYTRAERIFGRMLQENHIPFKTKQIINGREADFVIGKYAVEIDGHVQDTYKNHEFFAAGYTPLHYMNHEVILLRETVEKQIKEKWQRQI